LRGVLLLPSGVGVASIINGVFSVAWGTSVGSAGAIIAAAPGVDVVVVAAAAAAGSGCDSMTDGTASSKESVSGTFLVRNGFADWS